LHDYACILFVVSVFYGCAYERDLLYGCACDFENFNGGKHFGIQNREFESLVVSSMVSISNIAKQSL
jgi:hypothetical protein